MQGLLHRLPTSMSLSRFFSQSRHTTGARLSRVQPAQSPVKVQGAKALVAIQSATRLALIHPAGVGHERRECAGEHEGSRWRTSGNRSSVLLLLKAAHPTWRAAI